MYKYENICKNAGGVNQPKIIVCIGSDGKRYKQLCKVSSMMPLEQMGEGVWRVQTTSVFSV